MLKIQALKWYITCHNCQIFSPWKISIFPRTSFVFYWCVKCLLGSIFLSVLVTLSRFCGTGHLWLYKAELILETLPQYDFHQLPVVLSHSLPSWLICCKSWTALYQCICICLHFKYKLSIAFACILSINFSSCSVAVFEHILFTCLLHYKLHIQIPLTSYIHRSHVTWYRCGYCKIKSCGARFLVPQPSIAP